MISQVTFNRDKWIAALMLDPVTGLDPPGVRVRAAEGIDAASSFIQGYWLWYVHICSSIGQYNGIHVEINWSQVEDCGEPCGGWV